MFNLVWEACQGMARRPARSWRLWRAEQRFRRDLGQLSDAQLERTLADAGMSRGDLVTVLGVHRTNRGLMARMMAHFKVDPRTAAIATWAALRDAERVCGNCRNTGRCRRWLDWGAVNDAPRLFCPNAELFDQIAESRRR